MEFEFDERKSRANAEKHGIGFAEARYLVVGMIDGKHWSAVITYRENRIRLISCRRSRAEEVAIYEGE